MKKNAFNLSFEELQVLYQETLYSVDMNTTILDYVAEVTDNDIDKAGNSTDKEILKFNYLGENNKFILILLYYPAGSMPRSDFSFFEKIIQALNLTIKDLAIVNYHKYDRATFSDFKDFFACSKVISIGMPQDSVFFNNVNVSNYAVTTLKNVDILTYPHSLKDTESDKNLKIKLWNSLKLLFNVK